MHTLSILFVAVSQVAGTYLRYTHGEADIKKQS